MNIFEAVSLGKDLTQFEDLDVQNKEGWTPLMIASSIGNYEICSFLLEKKVDVNKTNNLGNTALHFAASKNHLRVVELLIKHKALSLPDKYNRKPIYRAVTQGHEEMVKLLLEHYEPQDCLIHLALEENHMEIVKLLVQKLGPEILEQRNEQNKLPHEIKFI